MIGYRREFEPLQRAAIGRFALDEIYRDIGRDRAEGCESFEALERASGEIGRRAARYAAVVIGTAADPERGPGTLAEKVSRPMVEAGVDLRDLRVQEDVVELVGNLVRALAYGDGLKHVVFGPDGREADQ